MEDRNLDDAWEGPIDALSVGSSRSAGSLRSAMLAHSMSRARAPAPAPAPRDATPEAASRASSRDERRAVSQPAAFEAIQPDTPTASIFMRRQARAEPSVPPAQQPILELARLMHDTFVRNMQLAELREKMERANLQYASARHVFTRDEVDAVAVAQETELQCVSDLCERSGVSDESVVAAEMLAMAQFRQTIIAPYCETGVAHVIAMDPSSPLFRRMARAQQQLYAEAQRQVEACSGER